MRIKFKFILYCNKKMWREAIRTYIELTKQNTQTSDWAHNLIESQKKLDGATDLDKCIFFQYLFNPTTFDWSGDKYKNIKSFATFDHSIEPYPDNVTLKHYKNGNETTIHVKVLENVPPISK